MHGANGTHGRRDPETDAIWWLAFGGLVVVLALTYSIAGTGPPLSAGAPALDTSAEAPSTRTTASRYDTGDGWWSIEAASNGIVFVHHD